MSIQNKNEEFQSDIYTKWMKSSKTNQVAALEKL